MSWKPHGSNAEYWRDDNPLIQMWYRFGDDLPPNNYQGDTPEDHLSGLMTDSSMCRSHLFSRCVPEDSFSPTSGIAPWSVSGLIMNGTDWTQGVSPCVIGQHRPHGSVTDDDCTPGSRGGDDASIGQGFQGFGAKTAHSGMMVAGWCQVEPITDRPDVRRNLWGDIDINADGGNARWGIMYTQNDLQTTSFFSNLRFIYRNDATLNTGGTNGNSTLWNASAVTATIDNSASMYPIPMSEPFFFCYTIHRELHPETQSPCPHEQNATPWASEASGLMTMYLGTHESGLMKVAEHLIQDNILGCVSRNIGTDQEMAIGNFEGMLRGTSSQRPMPPGTIVDEFVFVHDGYIGFDKIEHYMNSGILTFPENNPERPEFVPQLPGTDDLNAYFTWDNNDSVDNWLANSAPATSSLFASMIGQIGGAKDKPGPGIRGGSGMVIGAGQGPRLTSNWAHSHNGDKWHVPVGSGRNWMFPDINRSQEMTWIGWMRPAELNTTFSFPSAGWFADDVKHHAFSPTNWNTGGTGNDANGNGYNAVPGGTNFSVSGSVDHGTNLLFDADNSPVGWGNGMGGRRSQWSLWAFVIDFARGVCYTVKDAKHVSINALQIAPGSGWSDGALLNNPNFGASDQTTEGSAFTFAEAGVWSFPNTPSVNCYVDDWAFYDRALTLPEMSGYALSGVAVTSPEAPLDVGFKQTMGYWKLNSSGVYDPTGVSGIRFDDTSWYSHHLTNVSGAFSLGSALNTSIDSSSLQLDTSGSMLSLERVFTGSNLDFGTDQTMSSSGFSAGMWAYVPSGDLSTQGNGSSGLFGPRVLMGNWHQDTQERSWYLGADDNILAAHIVLSNLIDYPVTSDVEIPFNTPFFLGVDVQPSGSVLNSRLWYSTNSNSDDITQIAETSFGASVSLLNTASASGFSLFNAPHLNYGFPETTRGQGALIYNGALDEATWGKIKNLSIGLNTLGSDSVSASDPANISHWKFDYAAPQITDVGLEQNFLFPINLDGKVARVEAGVHNSGVVIRQSEYLDTLPNNVDARRLDLGSGTQSWTLLGWVKPNAEGPTGTDQHVLMSKGGQTSGVYVYMPPDNFTVTASASGVETRSQNGDISPGEWNHVAIIFDRDNNEFTTAVNGRYAGPGFVDLVEVPVNSSGLSLGGRGDEQFFAVPGGSAFSGNLDDVLLFGRALTLPEISGIAGNSYTYDPGTSFFGPAGVGGYISGIAQFAISGLIGSFMHGQAQDLALYAGYVSGVEGLFDQTGGYMHGKAVFSGLAGGYMHGKDISSGVFGHFMHGMDIVSGLIGSYEFGACTALGEFDITLNFQVVTNKSFDARLGVEKTQLYDFDARLGVTRQTAPPVCSLETPAIGLIASGMPYVLTVGGSGIAQDGKKVAMTRFTFADFKGSESGTLVSGEANSGLFEASREFDTPGWYTVKIEVLDSYGYRSSCVRPFLLIPSGTPSGTFLNSLPGISLTETPVSGTAIHTAFFTHGLSGLNTTSGLLEYTDFADQQESLVNTLEFPSGTQFNSFVRRHDYTMPGNYAPVWAVSGSFGIVSDTLSDGIDYIA